MINVEHIESWRGQQVLDPAGEQLGKLEEIYLDRVQRHADARLGQERPARTPSKLVPIDGADRRP